MQKAVKDHGQGLNTNDWQHAQTSLATGRGLNPVTVQQSVSSDLTGIVNSSSNDMAVGGGVVPLFNINSVGVEEKFANSIIHFKQFSESQISLGIDSPIFQKWSEQSDFQFGLIPLGEQLMSN